MPKSLSASIIAGLLAMCPVIDGHASAGPVMQQQVVVGLLDTAVERSDFARIRVTAKSFIPEGSTAARGSIGALTHADQVLLSMDRAAQRYSDRDIHVLAANAMNESNGKTMISGKGMQAALLWFRANGVKVVITTFASKAEVPSIKSFVDSANSLGMIVVSSIGNTTTDGVPFPAAYSSVIAVAGDQSGTSILKDRAFRERIDIVGDGFGVVSSDQKEHRAISNSAIELNPMTQYNIEGSSFAAGAVGVGVAVAVAEIESASVGELRLALRANDDAFAGPKAGKSPLKIWNAAMPASIAAHFALARIPTSVGFTQSAALSIGR